MTMPHPCRMHFSMRWREISNIGSGPWATECIGGWRTEGRVDPCITGRHASVIQDVQFPSLQQVRRVGRRQRSQRINPQSFRWKTLAGARSIQRNVRRRLVLSGIRERVDAPVFPAPVLLQPSVRAAWLHRWRGLLACTAARSFAESLLGNTAPGVDGAVPSMRSVISATCCELWS